MNRSLVWVGLSLLAPVAAEAQRIDSSLTTLVAAEHAFARVAAKHGTPTAFLSFVAEDGVVFRPGPVGREFYVGRPTGPSLLSWYPARAMVALSGDIGVTTGPWEWRAAGASDTVAGTGTFVTVWRRDGGGNWKVKLDIGGAHAPAGQRPKDLVPVPLRARPWAAVDPGVAWRDLYVVDSTLAAATSADGMLKTVPLRVVDDALFIHPDSAPYHGKGGVRRVTALELGALRAGLVSSASDCADSRACASSSAHPMYTTADVGVSLAGDLGYTWGVIRIGDAAMAPVGYYVRVWRKEILQKGRRAAPWKIWIEVVTAAPPATP